MAQVGPLARSPLDGSGVREVGVFEVRTTGTVEHACTITALGAVLEDGRGPAERSLLLPAEPERRRTGSASAAERSAWEFDGAVVRVQVPFAPGTSLYGTGLVPGPLLRNGRSTVLWNTDAWCYGEESPSLYQSHSYALALLPNGRAVGLLADTPRRGAILCAEDGVEMQFEAEPFWLYRIEAAHPLEVYKGLAALIGTIELPPRWALGYHQCRWSYMDEGEVRALAAEFRARKIPCDALWLDIDYMRGLRVFTVDRERFPDLAGLTGDLEREGFKTVAIVDPGVAVDPSYDISREGIAGDHFVQDSRGALVRGRVWPGSCHFPDFTREETRAWWSERVCRFVRETGLAGLWNDMNEPSVFRVPTRTLPEGARHRGLGGGTHGRFHNLYGALMAESTRAGLVRARPDRRPFVLTRAAHVASARHSATWTGDNQSRWEDLRASIPMVLNLGLSGQPFSGPDVGGFLGDPDEELFVRWFELGAYLPFFRGHSEKSSCRKEPWAFGAAAEAHVRAAIERRMALLPYLATCFHAAAESGVAVARPLWMADPRDPELRGIDDAFLLGGDLLVAPVVEAGVRQRTVRLPSNPGGGWYGFPAGETRLTRKRVRVPAALGTTPVFARAGSIIALGEVRRAASDGFGESLTLHVFLDRRGEAEGGMVEGPVDGPATGSANGEANRIVRWRASFRDARLKLEEDTSGTFFPPQRGVAIQVHGAPLRT